MERVEPCPGRIERSPPAKAAGAGIGPALKPNAEVVAFTEARPPRDGVEGASQVIEHRACDQQAKRRMNATSASDAYGTFLSRSLPSKNCARVESYVMVI